jgi:protein tyrosine/serine phosphatase
MARRLGIERVSLPLDDFGVVTDEQIRVGLEILTDETKQPILFGCRGARHRAGVLCAMYRMRVQGWSGEKALEEAKRCGYYPNGHRTFDKRFRQLMGIKD